MAKPINVFDDDNFSQGQGIFPDGLARWDEFRFVTFDFKIPGNDQICLRGMGQPLNADGTENGDPRPVYWPVTMGKDNKGDAELVSPIKGEKGCYAGICISESNKHGKLFGLADFSIWRDHLKAASKLEPELVDLDEAGTDITVLDGIVTEIAKYTKPEYAPKVKDDDKKEAAKEKKTPWQVVIIAALIDPKSLGKKSGKGKATAEVEAPAKKGAGKSKTPEVSDDLDDIVTAYCDAELTADKEGDPALNFKIGITSWVSKTLGKDADIARAAQSHLKENFAALLKANGWSLVKGNLAKD